MNTPKILEQIVNDRKARIDKHGHDMGSAVPDERPSALPVSGSAFSKTPFVICEIKRSSPSRGNIDPGLDPVGIASRYTEAGITSISVLTEQDRFGGSLDDLMSVKRAFPEAALLRKDFLIDVEDIEVSYRAGADAVLLIAAILNPGELAAMYNRATELGMASLVEVHDESELQVVVSSGVRPGIMGINCRNLNSFVVDMLAPLELVKNIDWSCELVYESGIFSAEQAAMAAAGGFTGVLVGEAAVRNAGLPNELRRGISEPAGYPAAGSDLWESIRRRRTAMSDTRPLVKICGITNADDGRMAAELGADLLGFVFAESPRRAGLPVLRELAHLDIIKIAVVTDPPGEELVSAWKDGLIQGFQYHGDEDPAECLERKLPFYKAIRVQKTKDAARIMDYPSPRVLIDAWTAEAAGGTGKRLDGESVRAAAGEKPLWLAGGLNPSNVASVIREHAPELIDASSGLENAPGRKDHDLLRRYFEEIRNAGI